MIGLIASLVSAVILRDYFMLLAAPAVFAVSLKSRDIGLVAYLLYTIYAAPKVYAGDVYSYGDLTRALVFALPALLLLEDVLRTRSGFEKAELVPTAIILLGPVVPEAVVAGALLYFAILRPDWRVTVPVAGIGLTFAFLRGTLAGLGTPGQTVVLGAFTLFTVALAFLLRNARGREMFTG